MSRLLSIASVLLAILLAATGSAAADGKRLALVIGVSNYSPLRPLPVARLDSESVRSTLETQLKYDVKYLADPTRQEIIDGWDEVLAKVTSADDIVVLYYAGHGVEINGGNYLIPRDVAWNPNPEVVVAASVSFKYLYERVAAKQSQINVPVIFILDACRENPFKTDTTLATQASNVGLAPLRELPKSVFVLYSAGIGQLALDGKPPNSVYTKNLAQLLKDQASDESALADMAQKLRYLVYRETLAAAEAAPGVKKIIQTPAYYDQLPTRLSITGTRQINQIKLAAVGDSLVDATLVRGLSQGDILKECVQCPELAVVGPGSVDLGVPERGKTGTPIHVTFEKPFAIGRFEITNAEWNACYEASKGQSEGCRWSVDLSGDASLARLPVSNVTWSDAQAYIKWLNAATKRPLYRLPTEAEWEFAARAEKPGDERTAYTFGNDAADLCDNANGADATIGATVWVNLKCKDPDHFGRTAAPVGSFKPNRWGLFDVHGNVAEWVQDCWQSSYDPAIAKGAAHEAKDCARRVIRGGSWRSGPAALRSDARNAVPPGTSRGTIGFRIARNLE